MSDPQFADWLRAQFTVHKNKSKADLARALGLEPPAVSKILNGTRQIKAHEYVIMRRFFGLPVDGQHALSPRQTAETHTGAFHDSQGAFAGDWDIPDAIITKTAPPRSPAPNNTYKVPDHLMAPEFARDDTVLVDPFDCTPTPPGIFVVSDKFSHMVRHCEIVPYSNPPSVIVTATDKNFQRQELALSDFEIIGRVVGKVSWLS